MEGISIREVSEILFKDATYFCPDITDSIIDDFNNKDKKYILSHGFCKGDIPTTTVYTETNQLYGGHYYSAVSADEKYVYIVNPHETSKKLKLPRDFAKMFFDVEYIELNND